MGLPDYVELRAKSAFSFLEAASNPEDLISRAAELGHTALALGDRDGLSGTPRFHTAARAAGLRALVGAELSDVEGRPLLLLATSRAGYRHLARLLTVAQGNAPKGEARASWDEVEAHAGGLFALVSAESLGRDIPCLPEEMHQPNAAREVASAPAPTQSAQRARSGLPRGSASRGASGSRTSWLERAASIFGPRLAVDVARSKDRAQEAAARRAVALAEALRIPVAASGDVRAAQPAGRKLLDALLCLRHHTTLDQAGKLLLPNGERVLRSPAEMAARFADRPAWLRATRAIAEQCEFTLADLGYRFPTFPTAPGESQAALLRRLAHEGARRRYGARLSARVRAQLEHELAVIEKLDLAGYFLIVWDIARFAREQGILCQGRGSAANSAVCYALEITAVDPVGMELLFERFLSEERGEWPDIDLDLPSGDPRERVIQYVYARYGPHGVGMTATVITYRTRSAFREMGRVLGMSADACDKISKHLHHLHFREDLDDVRALLRSAGVDPDSPRIQQLLDLAGQVQGLPRHLGQHTGGLVISAGRLDEVVPIEPAAMPGRRVIQWDKEDCADLGLIKIDLLGLGMLDALEQMIPLIRRHEGIEIDLAHLPPDDPKTYGMIQRADTVGVFQIESRAQMATLPRMKPAHFYDLVVEIAIIRPGPIVGQMVHPYLNRRAGREPVRYPHPLLEPILKRTLGVPIFQEQLLRLAMTAAGFSGGEAEELRRAMGFKRSAERMAQIESRLRAGMTARGIVGDAQEEVVRGITSFALYGFPESHSASFALIAYASAYLRAHHPAAFLAGLLNAWPMGFYSPATLVKDAERHGVPVLAIDATASEWGCTLERVVTNEEDGAVGLRLSGSAAERDRGRASAEWLARSTEALRDLGADGTGRSGDAACCALVPLQRAPGPAPPRAGSEVDPPLASAPSGAPLAQLLDALCEPGVAVPPWEEGEEVRERRDGSSSRGSLATRLGLRFVRGLSAETGARIVAERAATPFASLADFARRAAPKRNEIEALAESGALASLDARASERRAALWQVTGLERDRRSLFAGVAPPDAERDVPLAKLSALETTLADYRTTGLTTGPHVMSHLREQLRARGVLATAELRTIPNGRFVRTAGHVIVRQRPGSAKGFCFVTLEDETGTTNGVFTPDQFEKLRGPLHASPLIEIAGPIQNVDGVIHVRVREVIPLDGSEFVPESHDYR
jgi:error-prone DNA polymerase